MKTTLYLLLALGAGRVLNGPVVAQSVAPQPAPKVVQAAKPPSAPGQGEAFEELGYLFVEQMPVFQGGTSTLTHYLADHMQ